MRANSKTGLTPFSAPSMPPRISRPEPKRTQHSNRHPRNAHCATRLVTQNPEEADFFFVPIYPACMMTKKDFTVADLEKWYVTFLTTEGTLQNYYYKCNEGRRVVH